LIHQERVAVRTDTLHSRRDKFEREVMQFFDEVCVCCVCVRGPLTFFRWH
jgi:hypothetical protein